MLVRPSNLEFTLSVDWIRANAFKVHFFGLGFIQAKITPNARLHFYHPSIPAFVEEPHDHRYDFISNVLQGTLRNRIWRLIDGSDHEVSYENCQQDGPEVPKGYHSGLQEVGYFDTRAVSGYHMNSETLHTVEPNFSDGPVVTLVEREMPRKEFAKAVRMLGSPSVCPFSRPMPEDEMWDIVRKCLQGSI